LIEKRKNTRPRPHVMSAYNASHEKYAELYQKLAEMTDYLTMPEVLWCTGSIAPTAADPAYGVRGTWKRRCFGRNRPLRRPHRGSAALWESLAQYHPFIDANERTAFASTYTFLTINGLRLTATAEETYSFISDLYPTNGFSFEVLVPWLRRHVDLCP